MNSLRFKKRGREGAAESVRSVLAGAAFCFAIAFLTFQSVPGATWKVTGYPIPNARSDNFPSRVPDAVVQGASTISDYANRLNQAEQITDEVMEEESPAQELVIRMNAIKRLLPASEKVGFGASTIDVDNAWLHKALDNVIENARGDIEQRHSMLSEIADRLANLQRSVKAAQETPESSLQDQRARLDNILARSEYQPEERRESTLENWVRRIRNFIINLLDKLFGGAPSRAPASGGGRLVVVIRILVSLAVLAALIFGAFKLAQRLQTRKKPEDEAETREVLGEEVADDATAADLFAKASELAQQGEYRKAIRRAYIALLCDLEQRGKLRLSRSKTNRDYLDAMRPEQRIYPTFSAMTNAFEHVWYGQERATEDEFKNFVELYQETVK